MTPIVFAQAIVSIEQNYGLRLDARSVWLRMDEFKKVKELAGGKCNEAKGWYGLKGACKRGKKGEGEARSKESKVDIANRIKKRKMNESSAKPGVKTEIKPSQPRISEEPAKGQRKIDYEVKQSKLLDMESISTGGAKPVSSRIQSIIKSGLQSELPIVIIKGKKGANDVDTDTYSGQAEVASYQEAAKRDPKIKGRMDVIAVSSKEEALEALGQQNMIAKHSKSREPIKEAILLDVESFKVKHSDFDKKDIEKLAQSISKNGGIYQGPQVRQSGADEWSTRSRSDDFAVLAYRRAQELNPKLKGRTMAQLV